MIYNKPLYALWYGLIQVHKMDYENALMQFQYASDNGFNDSRIR